jgi:UDP-N-acetylmuramoylalanine--D-glutamate ligase
MDFRGKKITLMGLGLLGRGLGDAKFFAAAGADLIITDLKTEAELAPSIAELRQFPNIVFHLGGHQMEDFENRDLIIRAPNAPLDSPFLAHAREHGILIEMDAALFVKLCHETPASPASSLSSSPAIVGVTGTRGKSTVTQLIYEMARAAFDGGDSTSASSSRKVYLGGNVRDTATLPLIEKISGDDIVVLELDSWQLQGFAEDAVSPNIAVWTNFMPDHMNYYHGDMEQYFEDKAAIARFQKPSDVFIAPREIKEKIEARFGALAGKYIEPIALPLAGEESDWEIALPGEHNRANAACAIAAARALAVPDQNIKKILKTFHGLPNRLELLGKKNGIAFYNDSNATTPDATIAALRALTLATPLATPLTTKNTAIVQRPIILIAGGSDKELDFAQLASEIEKLEHEKIIKKIILLEGKASEKLKAKLSSLEKFPVTMVKNMDEAVDAAKGAAVSGDIILLSPAATSFGIFKNEYDRGEQFKNAFDRID